VGRRLQDLNSLSIQPRCSSHTEPWRRHSIELAVETFFALVRDKDELSGARAELEQQMRTIINDKFAPRGKHLVSPPPLPNPFTVSSNRRPTAGTRSYGLHKALSDLKLPLVVTRPREQDVLSYVDDVLDLDYETERRGSLKKARTARFAPLPILPASIESHSRLAAARKPSPSARGNYRALAPCRTLTRTRWRLVSTEEGGIVARQRVLLT
jgi:hypothetical protein